VEEVSKTGVKGENKEAMPPLRLTESDWIETDEVEKIDYLPVSITDFATELAAEQDAFDVLNPSSPSELRVVLKSGREIVLTGQEADVAWAAWGAIQSTKERRGA
jgi:hypothetical protein